MTYKTDSGGFAFKCNDIKVFTGSSSWATRISSISRHNEPVRIITYSIPDISYVREQLQRRPDNIYFIANEKFINKVDVLQSDFRDICFAVHKEVHSKILLIAPRTVYISSANFGRSKWHESCIGLHSKEAHDWYVNHIFEPLWDVSTETETTFDHLHSSI